MNGGGDELFSRARFAGDEHARVGRRDLRDHLANATKRRTASDHLGREPEVGAQRSRFAPDLSELQRGREREEHALRRQRLLEKGERAELRRANGVAQTGPTTHHHDGHVRHSLSKRREHAHAVELSGHHEIDEREVGLGFDRERDAARAVRRLAHLVALGGEERADHPADVRLVVDDEYRWHAGGP